MGPSHLLKQSQKSKRTGQRQRKEPKGARLGDLSGDRGGSAGETLPHGTYRADLSRVRTDAEPQGPGTSSPRHRPRPGGHPGTRQARRHQGTAHIRRSAIGPGPPAFPPAVREEHARSAPGCACAVSPGSVPARESAAGGTRGPGVAGEPGLAPARWGWRPWVSGVAGGCQGAVGGGCFANLSCNPASPARVALRVTQGSCQLCDTANVTCKFLCPGSQADEPQEHTAMVGSFPAS